MPHDHHDATPQTMQKILQKWHCRAPKTTSNSERNMTTKRKKRKSGMQTMIIHHRKMMGKDPLFLWIHNQNYNIICNAAVPCSWKLTDEKYFSATGALGNSIGISMLGMDGAPKITKTYAGRICLVRNWDWPTFIYKKNNKLWIMNFKVVVILSFSFTE